MQGSLLDRIDILSAAAKEKDDVIQTQEQELREAGEKSRLLPDYEAEKNRFLAQIEAERRAAEIQFNKVKKKEGEARLLEAENAALQQKAKALVEKDVLGTRKLNDYAVL